MEKAKPNNSSKKQQEKKRTLAFFFHLVFEEAGEWKSESFGDSAPETNIKPARKQNLGRTRRKRRKDFQIYC